MGEKPFDGLGFLLYELEKKGVTMKCFASFFLLSPKVFCLCVFERVKREES